jgi:hypothetical protein
MAKSLLAAVHDAVVGAASERPDQDENRAAAQSPTQEEMAMSNSDKPAGGDKPNAGISQAEHDAGVKAAAEAARAEGEAAGAKAATDRLVAALGAEGVKGDAGRMSAALELAQKSPGMSGEDVAAFVAGNVASAGKQEPAADYERQRLAGIAKPGAVQTGGGKKATINTSGIYAARRKQLQEG